MKQQISEGVVSSMCRALLEEIGEDPDREGLQRTPERFETAMKELTCGYQQNIDELVNGAIFNESYSEMVMIKDVEFYSLCEHHILPFFGKVHVAYLPNNKIIGLSKIPRIIHMFARRLQVQERLTEQVVNTLDDLLQPKGVACMIEGSHMCMKMRGVQLQSSMMVTTAMRGVFDSNTAARDEFMKLVTA